MKTTMFVTLILAAMSKGKEFFQDILKGANLEHAQILLLESGAFACYNNYQSCEKNKQTTHQHSNDPIMEYVDRLKPMVREEFINTYDQLWLGILELEEVKLQVYDKGKQQDTVFNRNLVAQIIHQIAAKVYVPTANTVKMAEYLEPERGAQHSVRQKLGESPEKEVKKAIELFMKRQ